MHGRGENRLAVVDCGVKHGILRELVGRGFTVVRVPCKSPPWMKYLPLSPPRE